MKLRYRPFYWLLVGVSDLCVFVGKAGEWTGKALAYAILMPAALGYKLGRFFSRKGGKL